MAQMKVLPHAVPGTLHVQNKGTLDWGWQGLIAYGCHGMVVVVDPRSVQCLQTLTHHKANIIKVRWASGRHNSSLTTPYLLRLASIDSTSHCVVWDASQGIISTEFSLGNKPLVDAQWLETNDSCRDLLAVMLSPGVMTIWNADTGTKVSRFTFTETIMSFAFNPFQPEHLVLQSTDCFVFVSDFNPSRTPTGGGKKYYLSNGTGMTPPLPGRNKSPPVLHQRLISGEDIKSESVVSLSDCLQICFSRASRHRLFLLYQREVVIVDTEMKQTVGVILNERNASPFYHITPCWQRDMLYCLHENGCVSVRMQQPVHLPSSIATSPLDHHPHHMVHYDLHGHSETLRISKTCQVYAGAVSPYSEVQVAVLTSEGRLLLWEVEFQQVGVYGQDTRENSLPVMLTAHPVKEVGLVSVEPEKEEQRGGVGGMEKTPRLTLSESIAPHWFVPPTGCTSLYGVLSMRLILGNLWVGIPSTPTALRMCPPLTTKNWLFYAPLVAMGTTNGSLLVYNLHSKVIMKLYSVHSCPVRGIEWINQVSFISYAYSTPNASGNVRNEVAAVNIQTGKVSHLSRPDKPAGQLYSTPVDTIKISTHRQYLVIKYKDRPLEFWDLKTLTFLREMVSNPPSFNCVEWTPLPHRIKSTQSKPDFSNGGGGGGGGNLATVDFDVAMGATDSKMAQALAKEQLTVMDVTGCMWQIGIEGSKVKVVQGTPIQTYLNSPTCVTWKNEVLAAGDSDGVLFLHDTKLNRNRTVETPRAAVKKIRFAPGKGNSKLFVLYSSRLDIRDAQSDVVISQLKWGGKEADGGVVVEDVDWATSDKPIIITSDGVVRIYDLSLQKCQSEFTLAEFKNPVFCPHSMPPMASRRLKVILQHQPWNVEYSLVPSDHDIDGTTAAETDTTAFRAQLEHVPEEFVDGLLDAPLGTSERAFITANLYGDQSAVEFWSVALHYLLLEKHRNQNSKYQLYKTVLPRNPISDIIRPDSDASISIGSSKGQSTDDLLEDTSLGADSEGGSIASPSASRSFDFSENNLDEILRDSYLKTLEATPPLDLFWDLLCDKEIYQKIQLDRVSLHDAVRVTYQHTKKCSDMLLLLGQTDRAVQLLLETESSSTDYFNDALKACLAATIRSSGASQSTIKLVATNLIANSKLVEGVQLLCLIDKQQDACRYLQTYGEWEYSVWLAKSTLRENYYNDVLSKWVDHLASVGVNQKNKALLVLLSLGHFTRVIEMLYSMRRFDQASIFIQCCLELDVLSPGKETTPLIHAVHLEYARYLLRLKFYRGFMHYCNKAGDKGQQLLQEYFKHGNVVSNKASLIDLTSKPPKPPSSPAASPLVDLSK